MKASTLVAGGVLVALGVAWWWVNPLGRELGPEAAVRALVAEGVDAAERADVAGVVELLSDDFRGPDGADVNQVKALLVSQLLRGGERLVVLNPSLEVSVTSPSQASFSGVFVFARGAADQPVDAAKYQLDATLERRGDRWLITSARWQR